MYIKGSSSSNPSISVVKSTGSKDYLNEHKPGAALQPVVTPAPKTVGAYLQTSTRHLIPDSKSILYIIWSYDMVTYLCDTNHFDLTNI